MKLDSITNRNVAWFQNGLSNRKQYIHIGENSKIDLKYDICGIPQRFIVGPILFLVYLKDQANLSPLLGPIILADDINLSCNHKNFKYLFAVVNK